MGAFHQEVTKITISGYTTTTTQTNELKRESQGYPGLPVEVSQKGER